MNATLIRFAEKESCVIQLRRSWANTSIERERSDETGSHDRPAQNTTNWCVHPSLALHDSTSWPIERSHVLDLSGCGRHQSIAAEVRKVILVPRIEYNSANLWLSNRTCLVVLTGKNSSLTHGRGIIILILSCLS